VSYCDVPLTEPSAKLHYDVGTPSPHGKGGQTVFDPTYRDAHEIKVRQDPYNATWSLLLCCTAGLMAAGPLCAQR